MKDKAKVVKGRTSAMSIEEVTSLIEQIGKDTNSSKIEVNYDEASEEFAFDYQFTRSIRTKTHQLTIFNLNEFAETVIIEIKPI